jgi:hypothetical protein
MCVDFCGVFGGVSFSLIGNQIGDMGATSLATAIRVNTTLTYLV